ncbi:MAG: DNA-protecting protein DprA [Clostridiales bacterium]|nr:DNA-protecting protein DprA [Clostridiales bacterium]
MTIDDKNILWLDLFEGLSYSKKRKILEIVGRGVDVRSIFLSSPQIKDILTEQEFNKMSLCLLPQFLEQKLKTYEDAGIKLITFFNEEYPYLLKEISTPPLCLYCLGNTQLLNSFCIGVVGTRKPTDYGTVVTKQFVKKLVANDITIVSGMAVGIDSVAHKTALEEEGNTIAVLAGGFNHVYPAINQPMFKKLQENNLVISENNPNTTPLPYLFPIRNRIIAGLSRGVFVPEAGKKSGSMRTIEDAVEFNRDIFILPGKINSPMSEGTNLCIKKYLGSIVLCPEDILDNFQIVDKENEKNVGIQLDMDAQIVLDYIKTEKKTFQQLADLTHLPTNKLNIMLMELEMNGLVIKLANNSYIMA